MRKLLAMLLIMTVETSFLVGCGSAKTDESVISTEEEISFTRGEWITGLASSLGMIEYTQEKAYFTDVDSNDEIFPYVQLATEWGLFEETGGAFEPEGKATREFVVATAVIAAETIEPSEGGLYLISALEGSGKTELMRQFVKICTEEVLVDYIGIVSYEESLRSSFIKAFPQANGTDFGNRYVEVLENMSTIKDKKVLLIIDNIDNSVDEKELELLCKLPITIFLTSNFQKMKGFKTYHLKPIAQDAACLIFRDNYGSYLDEEDKLSLDEIVTEELCGNVLKLRLLAKVAKEKGWSLQQLKKQLDEKSVKLLCE